ARGTHRSAGQRHTSEVFRKRTEAVDRRDANRRETSGRDGGNGVSKQSSLFASPTPGGRYGPDRAPPSRALCPGLRLQRRVRVIGGGNRGQIHSTLRRETRTVLDCRKRWRSGRFYFPGCKIQDHVQAPSAVR